MSIEDKLDQILDRLDIIEAKLDNPLLQVTPLPGEFTIVDPPVMPWQDIIIGSDLVPLTPGTWIDKDGEPASNPPAGWHGIWTDAENIEWTNMSNDSIQSGVVRRVDDK